MAAWAELIADGAERFQEALRMLSRLEPLEHPLTLAYWQVGVLRSLVQPFVASMFVVDSTRLTAGT